MLDVAEIRTPQPAFFNRTYDEAMDLLVEARNYMAYREGDEVRKLSPQDRLKVSYESMRVTCRLTQVMAWLLAQKAVHAGEMSLQQAASEEYALGGHEICMDEDDPGEISLPGGLISLLDRSHKLYLRVSRLDEMVQRQVA